MEQRDYLLREIEKIGILLRGMIGKLMGRKQDLVRLSEDSFQLFAEEFERETRLELSRILETPQSELGQVLRKEDGFDEANIELLADFLATVELEDRSKGHHLKRKALEIYEFLNYRSKSFSMERRYKMEQLKSKLY